MYITKYIINTILILLIIDMFILFGAMMLIAAGESVNNIPFWDAQIRFVIELLS